MSRALLPFALLLASAGAASAQSGAAAVTVPQVSAPGRAGDADVAESPASGALDRRGRENLVSAGAPLGEGRLTAEASPDLSTRAQGRAVGVGAPIGGHDRCDSEAAAQTELCRGRIEARSGDYAKPGAAPVTAEGRLLILSDPQNQPQSFDSATRRLGGAPMVDALAGSAAAQLAGAIDPQRAGSGAATAPAAGAATGLPAGLPSTVVISPH